MDRNLYIFLLIIPFVLVGTLLIVYKNELDTTSKFFIILSGMFYIMLINTLRMIKLKFTLKQILLSFIPFVGLKYRSILFSKK